MRWAPNGPVTASLELPDSALVTSGTQPVCHFRLRVDLVFGVDIAEPFERSISEDPAYRPEVDSSALLRVRLRRKNLGLRTVIHALLVGTLNAQANNPASNRPNYWRARPSRMHP